MMEQFMKLHVNPHHPVNKDAHGTKIKKGYSSMTSLLHEVRKETVMEIYSFYEKSRNNANTISIP